MDFYSVVNFLHVVAAILWLGGGFSLVFLGIMAERTRDEAAMMTVIRQVASLSLTFFIPASLATVLFGLVAAFASWGFSFLWIWIGLAGFAATFVTGNFFLKPRAEQITKLEATGAHDKAVGLGREILSLAKFDYTMLFVVVADMVFRPQWSNWLLLLIMVAVLVGAGYLYLLPVVRKPVSATA